MKSNVNKWNGYFRNHRKYTEKPFPPIIPMEIGSKFLEDCKTVEDWGTGDGVFKLYRKDAVGVDGSDTPGADKKFIDLCEYTSNCEGIFLKHVLEHNYDWEKIVKNALNSATKKICIVMFLPFSENSTNEISYDPIGVPNLCISRKALMEILDSFNIDLEMKPIGQETVIFITKK